MMSALFWLSFSVVFLGIRWFADALLSVDYVAVRRVRPIAETRPDATEQPWPSALDEAA